MDTLTHTICGAGLAFSAKVINPDLDVSLGLVGFSIAASNAPDFDVITKIFGNVTFINNHRGLTHTVVAWPILALPLALIFKTFAPTLANYDLMTMFIFALVGIALHVSLDVLNSYGTMLLPKGKWVRLSVTHTFDIVITTLLIMGTIVAYFYNYAFIAALLIILAYILLRLAVKLSIIEHVRNLYPNSRKTIVIATSRPYRWYVCLDTGDEFHTFRMRWSKQQRLKIIKKEYADNEHIDILKHNDIYKLFTKFSPMYNAHIEGNHLLLTDMRYRKNQYFYFKATFIIRRGRIFNSYVGWVFDERRRIDKVESKL